VALTTKIIDGDLLMLRVGFADGITVTVTAGRNVKSISVTPNNPETAERLLSIFHWSVNKVGEPGYPFTSLNQVIYGMETLARSALNVEQFIAGLREVLEVSDRHLVPEVGIRGPSFTVVDLSPSRKVPSQTICFKVSATVAAVTAAETGMFKGRYFDRSIILLCIRWYLAYNLSLRNLEEMMAERGISVDHATIHRWVIRYSPELLKRFNARKRVATSKWHVDETYIKVRGRWTYLYRAIDTNGDTVEFWFSERRNLTAAKRFLRKALKRHGRPERIVIDGSPTNREAILSCDTADRLQAS
jgi:transposase-like protein